DQEAMLAAWQQHTYAEFVLKDADAALATMTENPYVLTIPCGVGATGRIGVHEFYANHFLPGIPPDLELTSLWRTFGNDRLVEGMVMRLARAIAVDWMLPGLAPTGRRVEFAWIGVIQFEVGKVAGEGLYWDQASVLAQLRVLDQPLAAVAV